MWFPSLHSLSASACQAQPRSRPACRSRRRPASIRLTLERLEDRTVPGFLAPVSYAFPTDARGIAVGDFNNDGIPDLVVGGPNGSPGFLSVFLGNGDGTFHVSQTFSTKEGAVYIAVGDFNGDGKLDFVTANARDDLSVFLGNGDGTFRQTKTFTLPKVKDSSGKEVSQIPAGIAVGDFNHDGNLDLAVAGQAPSISQNYVNVLLGSGDGSFRAASTTAVGPGYVLGIAVGNFDGSGNLDVVATVEIPDSVNVLLGNGDGTLQAPTQYAAGISPVSVAVGDFNNDHIADLAVANEGTSNVSVLLGNGNGTFQPAQNFAVGLSPFALAVGDFNRDGKLDIVTANVSANNVSVLVGKGDGTFQAAQNFAAGGSPVNVAVGDFNRDGFPDLAVGISGGGGPGSLSVLINDATWAAPTAAVPALAQSASASPTALVPTPSASLTALDPASSQSAIPDRGLPPAAAVDHLFATQMSRLRLRLQGLDWWSDQALGLDLLQERDIFSLA